MTAARVLCCTALVAGSGLGLSALAGQPTVSSDGSVPPAVAGHANAGASFAGRWREGLAPDAQAEFPAATLSPAEQAAFSRTFRPLARGGAAELAPESVIGQDRRFRVYPKESGYPYRAIGLLTFTQGGANYSCTGWLISKDTVVTAGHCVHEGKGGGWSRSVKFYPARNGAASPFGSCGAKRLYAPAGWTGDGDDSQDYGAVKLNCAVGETTGWFGYYATAASQAGLAVLVMGYPGDKAKGTQWGSAGNVTGSEARTTYYQADTFGGESGAPVIEADRGSSRARCFGTCAVAVHTYGEIDGANSGTRITADVVANLTTWKNAP